MIARPRRRADEPDDRVPRPRHRGPRRADHRQGARPRTRRVALIDAEETRAARDPRRPRVRGRRRDDGARGAARLEARGWTLGVAESLTGGLIGARIANVPGASRTFRGSIASYATDVKRSVLGVDRGAGRERGVRGADGRGRAAGARRRRRHRGDRCRRPRRAGRPAGRHGLVRDRAARTRRPRPSPPACRATASASASSRRSRCSTSCGMRLDALVPSAATMSALRRACLAGCRRARCSTPSRSPRRERPTIVAVRVDPTRPVARDDAVPRSTRADADAVVAALEAGWSAGFRAVTTRLRRRAAAFPRARARRRVFWLGVRRRATPLEGLAMRS